MQAIFLLSFVTIPIGFINALKNSLLINQLQER